MTIKEEYGRFSKEQVYETYIRIIYEWEDYEKLTKDKMIDAIKKQYGVKNYLYNICTKRELDFLKYAISNKISVKDKEKYDWEINTLREKFIISHENEIYTDQLDNVKEAIKEYDKHPNANSYELMTFMIGLIRTNGNMLTMALKGLVSQITNVKEENIDALLGCPLFHFYCGFYKEYVESLKDDMEVVYYRDYYEYLDLIDEKRKTYGSAAGREFYPDDYFDMFYYGFPLRKASVKKMYEVVKQNKLKNLIFETIDKARMLCNEISPNKLIDEELAKIINEALEDIPCAVTNGATPKEMSQEKAKQKEVKMKFTHIPQNNAHLHRKDADRYYKLYFALLEFTNKYYKVNSNIERIYKQEYLKPEEIAPINDYLFEHKEIIDEFIDKNEYELDERDLKTIKGFKTAIKNECFMVVGFEREYTEILGTDGKVYMVKGVRSDIDKILEGELPIPVQTTLLMYDDVIIYNSFMSTYAFEFDSDIKESAYKEYKEGMRYYHL